MQLCPAAGRTPRIEEQFAVRCTSANSFASEESPPAAESLAGRPYEGDELCALTEGAAERSGMPSEPGRSRGCNGSSTVPSFEVCLGAMGPGVPVALLARHATPSKGRDR